MFAGDQVAGGRGRVRVFVRVRNVDRGIVERRRVARLRRAFGGAVRDVLVATGRGATNERESLSSRDAFLSLEDARRVDVPARQVLRTRAPSNHRWSYPDGSESTGRRHRSLVDFRAHAQSNAGRPESGSLSRRLPSKNFGRNGTFAYLSWTLVPNGPSYRTRALFA
jgi:hypothetical protein